MNINGHRIIVSPSTIQMGGLAPAGTPPNKVRVGWYIQCVTCNWREKAGDQETAQVRAYRHAEGAKLP